ncbi:SDR family NAD(P)-dependent oxidoreductase [Sphingobium sp. CFD-1]|uniref:SDR family NAD(P)-dependent oxidoreductase n=1 Tax=Sphingobium sp. CFD-1 TaxID=2878545 RepID=UPI00214ABB38|nr:SDR family NAD(P)-dependent oxidoreductase [Sphingobium sp. CFD-1]
MARNGNFVFVGGTEGIGRATALNVAQQGASILLVARSADRGAAAVDAMLTAGARDAAFLKADLSTIAGAAEAATAITAWRPAIDGLMHSAMSAFSGKTVTADRLEFAFALQYLARAIINRLCSDTLAASGDGRIVHLAGAVPYRMAPPDLDDLQFERRKWGFFKAILTTHVEGFLFLDEASRRWSDRPIGLYATGVASTKTKAMQDPAMPLIMQMMGWFGTTPEKSAVNATRLLLDDKRPALKAAIFKNPKAFEPTPFDMPPQEAARLWDITTDIATRKGVHLP